MNLINKVTRKISKHFNYGLIRFNHKNSQRHKIRALLDKCSIDLVLDVGANMGQFATSMRKIDYNGQIISFEPLKSCYEHLLIIADKQWQVENYALGDIRTTKYIHVSVDSCFSSFLSANDYGNSYFSKRINVFEKQQRIEIKTLDDVLPELVDNFKKRNIFLKIDTQGYDHLVMLGGARVLKYVDILQTEVSCKAIYQDTPSAHETLKKLAESNFNIIGIYPVSYDKNTLEMIEFDCLAVREKTKVE